LQRADAEVQLLHAEHPAICGQNERFSPPLVLFHDFRGEERRRRRVATLELRVAEVTPRSQFLAHFSFTSNSEGQLTDRMKGGRRRTYEEGEFREREGEENIWSHLVTRSFL